MSVKEFTNKLRKLDNLSNQWFIKHFYVLFFQIILVITFVMLFILTINTINSAPDLNQNSITERLLLQQNEITLVIGFLALLNSFWMLFMFAGLLRIRSVLKNMDFNLSRRKHDRRNDED